MTTPLLLQGDALHLPLRDASVQCCVCSPPYYGLRSYGIGAEQGEIGLEGTLEGYLAALVAVFREVWRVLRPDGTCWVNIGDSYASRSRSATFHGGKGDARQRERSIPHGLKPKDLCMVPARLALALQADGWTLRSEIVWAKPNPMPESVQDRPTRSHEMVYLFSKSPHYYYDGEAVREPAIMRPQCRLTPQPRREGRHAADGWAEPRVLRDVPALDGNPAGRNMRSVWSLSTEPTWFAHFATFPTALVRRCILAGTSAYGCCAACGAPWTRGRTHTDLVDASANGSRFDRGKSAHHGQVQAGPRYVSVPTDWSPTCACQAAVQPCTVLDPFCGSGTTLLVARELGRHGIGLDLSWPYLTLIARERLGFTALDRWEGLAPPRVPVGYADLPLFQEDR